MSAASLNPSAKKFLCRSAGATHVGLVRTNNEDNFLVTSGDRVLVVADGMGGEAKGEVASSRVIKVIDEALGHASNSAWASEEQVRAALLAAITTSDEQIRAQASLDPACKGMGSTVVALAYLNDVVHIAHIGDSRAYLMRGGALTQLTQDHTFVALLGLTPEQAQKHPLRHVLSRALGHHGQADHLPLSPEEGDLILLCSDGLSGKVPTDVIAQVLQEAENDLQRTVDRLIDETLKTDANDNVTVVLARLSSPKAAPKAAPTSAPALASTPASASKPAPESTSALASVAIPTSASATAPSRARCSRRRAFAWLLCALRERFGRSIGSAR
jgi:protein phosphatase